MISPDVPLTFVWALALQKCHAAASLTPTVTWSQPMVAEPWAVGPSQEGSGKGLVKGRA